MSFLKKIFKKKETTQTPVAEERLADTQQETQAPLNDISEEVQVDSNQAVEETQTALSDGEVKEVEAPLNEESKEAQIALSDDEAKEVKAPLNDESQETQTELNDKVEAAQVASNDASEKVPLSNDEEKEVEVVQVALDNVSEEAQASVDDEPIEAQPILDEAVEEVQAPLEEVQDNQDKPSPKKKGFFGKLVEGLAKTRNHFVETVDEVLRGFKKIDEDLYEELEEVLIMADFGVETTLAIIEALRVKVKEDKITEPEDLKYALQDIIKGILTEHKETPILKEVQPNVVLVIGVNGVGKTTTIGKLSHQLREDNKKVVLAAADTFRAAAIEQLQIWADRAQVDLIKQAEGSDPASVVYDGIQAAKARKADVLICDTAGRLQNKTNLMKELEKIGRIIDREYPEAHKEVLIVLDATTGQNAISQVKAFKETAKVDGIVLTKLDGTAKGGAIVGICQSMKVPVKYIGVGEQIDDLQPFDAQAFAAALFEESKK